jgi:hypothetical protein
MMICGGPGASIKIEDLSKIPVLRLQQEPVATVDDLYLKYPDGGEYGWYAFVNSKKMFYYWDVTLEKWEPTQSENLEDILPVDKSTLVVGDVPVWNGSSFQVMNINLFMTEDY